MISFDPRVLRCLSIPSDRSKNRSENAIPYLMFSLHPATKLLTPYTLFACLSPRSHSQPSIFPSLQSVVMACTIPAAKRALMNAASLVPKDELNIKTFLYQQILATLVLSLTYGKAKKFSFQILRSISNKRVNTSSLLQSRLLTTFELKMPAKHHHRSRMYHHRPRTKGFSFFFMHYAVYELFIIKNYSKS